MKLKANKPHHGESKPTRMGGLMAGAHLPQKVSASGISSGKERRNGKQTGHLKADGTSDTRARKGTDGNSKGSPPPGIGKGTARDALGSYGGDSGRGGTGRMGKSDAHKGRATPLSESPSSAWFEKLGST